MITNCISKWRKLARDGKGISKAHLARRIGKSRSYVTKLEQGAIQPSLVAALKICRYFKRPFEDVFEDVEGSEGPS